MTDESRFYLYGEEKQIQRKNSRDLLDESKQSKLPDDLEIVKQSDDISKIKDSITMIDMAENPKESVMSL